MKKYLLALGAAALFSAPASAAIVSGALTGGSAFNNGGSFQEFTPTTVGNNNQQSNNLFAFTENEAALSSGLTPDFGSVLIAGRRYQSHFVFFDPGPTRTAEGSVTFNRDILAVLASDANMNASDADFGLAGVTYLTPTLRGLEGPDSFSVTGNTISIDFRASDPGDYIRVLTGVPEPTTWAMLIFGFGAVGGAMRRGKKQNVRISYA